MAKINQRFQILFPEEEISLLKEEAKKRGVSQAELVRLALKNEIFQRSSLKRENAIRGLVSLFE